ncbi:MAG TPA: nucleotidyltransferase family protein [Chloroflexia bacterium]|nr:nucleotidyltransferase family protein [Chloroflexia bacterium]
MDRTPRLLIALAGLDAHLPGTLEQTLRDLDPATWAALLPLARAEGLAAMIAAHLDQSGHATLVPPAVCDALRRERRTTLINYTIHTVALDQIGAALRAAPIPFRVLKGLAIAQAVYPIPTTRAISDLDLWVPPAHLARAAALLQELGYAPVPSQLPAAFVRTFAKEIVFVPQGASAPPALVDLHWHPTAPWWMRATLRIPEQELFARPYPVQIGRHEYQTLDPTASLYYLGLHAGIGHRFQGLRWLIDIALLAGAGQVEWPRLNRLVTASGTGAILWRCLDLLDQTTGSRYAAHLARPPRRGHRALLRRLLPATLSVDLSIFDPEQELRVPLEQLILLPHPLAMAAALTRLLWPPAQWIRLRYAPLPAGGVPRARLAHLARLRHLAPRRPRPAT